MKRWLAAAAMLGVLVTAPFAAATTAYAHAAFESSNLVDRSTVAGLPATVDLTFSEAVGFPASLAVTDPAGNSILTGELAVVGRVMTQALDSSTQVDGTYRIAYQVKSVDGHSISGTIFFTVEGAGSEVVPIESTPAAVVPVESAPSEIAPAEVSPVAVVPVESAPSEVVAAEAASAEVDVTAGASVSDPFAETSGSGSDTLLVLSLLVALAAGLALGVFGLRRTVAGLAATPPT